MHLGLRIKVARISRKITQAELAERINKTRPLISSIEQTGKVNFYTLKKICDVLGLDIDVLTQSTEDLGVFTYKGGSDSVSKEKIKIIRIINFFLNSIILKNIYFKKSMRFQKF
jgi:transcriptional regulator with XRE-family HTH domain